MFLSNITMPIRPKRINTPSPVRSDFRFYEDDIPSSYSLNSCLDCSFLNDTELMSHVFGNVNFDFSSPTIDDLLETTTEVKTNCLWSEGANSMLSSFQTNSNAMTTSSSSTTTATSTTTTTSPRRPLQSFSSSLLDTNYGGLGSSLSPSSSNVLTEYCNCLAFTGGSSSSSNSSSMCTRNTNDRLRLSISSTTSTGSLSDPFSYCRRLHRESISASALNYFDNEFSENDNNNFVIWTDNSSENSSLKDPDHSESTLPTSSSCSPNSSDSYKVISKNQTSNNEFKVSEDHTYFSKKDETELASSSGAAVASTVTRPTDLQILSSSQDLTDKMDLEECLKSLNTWGQENKSLYGNQKLRHTEAHGGDIVTSIDDSETDDWFDFGVASSFMSSGNSRSNSCSSSCSSVCSSNKRPKKGANLKNSKSPQKSTSGLLSGTSSKSVSPKNNVTKAKYRTRKPAATTAYESVSANRLKNSQQRASQVKKVGRPSKSKPTPKKKGAEQEMNTPASTSAITISSSFLSTGIGASLRTKAASTSPRPNSPSCLLSSLASHNVPTLFFESEKFANTIPDSNDPSSSECAKPTILTSKNLSVLSRSSSSSSHNPIHTSNVIQNTSSSVLSSSSSNYLLSSNEDSSNSKTDLNVSNQTLIKTSIKRALHNNLEKQRRDALRIAFENLRNAVPKLIGNSKAAKIQILSESRHFCKELIKRQSSVAEEKQKLINKQKILIKQLCDSLL